jgi:hypothetical protein
MAKSHKEESVVQTIEKEEEKISGEMKKNPWMIATVVLGVLAIVLLYFVWKGGAVTGNAVSTDDIGTKAVGFINTQLLQGQGTVTLDSVVEKAGLYEVTVSYQSRKIPVYFTKDGEYYLGTQMISLTEAANSSSGSEETQPPAEVPKSDKPKVELFIMTYCPYGTQAEKGIIPALKALSGKIDYDIRFVHYFMHGDKEEAETYTQLCIREQQSAKFMTYLECFLEDGNSTRCTKKYGINVDACVKDKSKEYYASDSALSQGYGVQGSPTLVLNGVETQFYPRDPATALKTICAAFNNEPSECNSVLSTANPQPGFGTASTPSTPSTGSAASDAAASGACASA